MKGDVIINKDGNCARVVCVLKTKIKGGKAIMSTFNGMKVSPYHPIKIKWGSPWEFPNEIQKSKEVVCDWLYDFVLDKHHIITVNNIDVICLGHGFTHDPKLIHKFFGTEKVIDELKKDTKEWDTRKVIIMDHKFVHDRSTVSPVVDRFFLVMILILVLP